MTSSASGCRKSLASSVPSCGRCWRHRVHVWSRWRCVVVVVVIVVSPIVIVELSRWWESGMFSWRFAFVVESDEFGELVSGHVDVLSFTRSDVASGHVSIRFEPVY